MVVTIDVPSDIDTLKHMVGAESRYQKKHWGFRNHYCCGGEPQEVDMFHRLELAGLVSQINSNVSYKMYYVTRKGCAVIGLTKKQTENAMKGINR